jgi:hypothetical protein
MISQVTDSYACTHVYSETLQSPHLSCCSSARRERKRFGGCRCSLLEYRAPLPTNCAFSVRSCLVAGGRDRSLTNTKMRRSQRLGVRSRLGSPARCFNVPCNVDFGDAPFFNKTMGASLRFVQGPGILLAGCILGPCTEMKHVVGCRRP